MAIKPDKSLFHKLRRHVGVSPEHPISPRTALVRSRLEGADVGVSVCPYCAVGCSQLVYHRDGTVLSIEGNYESFINGGTLCPKGSATYGLVVNPLRVTTTKYRAPGSDHWEDISWDDAIARVAHKIRKTRDATWIATEKVDDKEVPVNRTDAIGFLGGAQNTNEECYLFQKAARLLGLAYVEHQARL